MFAVKEILDMAIRIEKNAETVYRHSLQNVTNPQFVSLLEWMAEEEVKHAKWFSDQKQKLTTPSNNPFVDEISRELFDDLLDGQQFSLTEADFSQIEEIDALIDIFIEFERDTVLFYQVLQPFVKDQATLDQLNKIIAEENSHIEQLQEFLTNEAAETLYSD
jgi:rubrerythrin